MRNKLHLTVCGVLTLCCLSSCKRRVGEAAGGGEVRTGTVEVYVVNYPLQYFAERIGGEYVDVVFPAPADGDPAFWKPDADVIAAYQNAELVLVNGATYAKWTRNASLPASSLINTTALVRDQYINVEQAATHAHASGEEHAHYGTAFTTWLDSDMAVAQAEAVRKALAGIRPQHAETFQQNCAALLTDLRDLDRQLTVLVGDQTELPLVCSHPVYQYLTRRYSLNTRSLHWEPDVVPSEEMWTELQELLGEHPAKFMVWEGDPLAESVDRLAQLGVSSVVFDPCENVPDEGDFLEVMLSNVANLQAVFGGDE